MPASLLSAPPFDRLTEPERVDLWHLSDVVRFESGEAIARSEPGPDRVHLIVSGVVNEVRKDAVVAVRGCGEAFDVAALLDGPSASVFVAKGPAACLILPGAPVAALARANPAFGGALRAVGTAKSDGNAAARPSAELQSLMTTMVGDAYLHPPLYVDAATPIHVAARRMAERRATSLLVRDGSRVGIVTGQDLRRAVILERVSVDAPTGPVASYGLVTIRTDDFLFNALLLLTRHAIRRLVVVDGDGEVVGVLEQVDLLSFLSNHSHIVALQVERATTISELREASRNIEGLVRVLHDKGARIAFLAQLVTELNRKVFARLYALLAPPDLLANACLIVMGSEGRGEQILRTDQDNGLILRDGFACADVERVGAAFAEALQSFGYPLCPGGVMASNPIWAKPLAAYRRQLLSAVTTSDERALLDVAILVDAAAVAGDGGLLAALRRTLFEALRDNSAFHARFARAIDSFDVPLGLFSKLIVERGPHKDALDLKKGGIFAVVHGVRSLALERGLSDTNTFERVRRLEELGVFDHRFALDLIEAFAFMLNLRLRARLAQLDDDLPTDNFVRPGELSTLEQDRLKDALGVVRELKEIVRHHFRLRLF